MVNLNKRFKEIDKRIDRVLEAVIAKNGKTHTGISGERYTNSADRHFIMYALLSKTSKELEVKDFIGDIRENLTDYYGIDYIKESVIRIIRMDVIKLKSGEEILNLEKEREELQELCKDSLTYFSNRKIIFKILEEEDIKIEKVKNDIFYTLKIAIKGTSYLRLRVDMNTREAFSILESEKTIRVRRLRFLCGIENLPVNVKEEILLNKLNNK